MKFSLAPAKNGGVRNIGVRFLPPPMPRRNFLTPQSNLTTERN